MCNLIPSHVNKVFLSLVVPLSYLWLTVLEIFKILQFRVKRGKNKSFLPTVHFIRSLLFSHLYHALHDFFFLFWPFDEAFLFQWRLSLLLWGGAAVQYKQCRFHRVHSNTKSWQRKSFYWCRKEFHDLMDKYGSHSDTSSARTSPTHHLAGERSLPSLKQSWGTKISLGWSRVLYLKFLIWGEVYWREGLKVRQNTHVPWGICVSVSPALKINILISTFNFK